MNIPARLQDIFLRLSAGSPGEVLSAPAGDPAVSRELQPLHHAPDFPPGWLFYSILAIVALSAWLTYNHRKEISKVFGAFFNIKLAAQLEREQIQGAGMASLLLNINFVLVMAHFVYLAIVFMGVDYGMEDFPLLTLITALLVLAFGIRIYSLKLIAWIFPFGEDLRKYLFNFLLSGKVMGMAVLPFVVLLSFGPLQLSPWVITPAFVLVAGVLGMRYIRGFRIGWPYFRFHKFHFSLYLCSVEIIPLVVLWKLYQYWVSA